MSDTTPIDYQEFRTIGPKAACQVTLVDFADQMLNVQARATGPTRCSTRITVC